MIRPTDRQAGTRRERVVNIERADASLKGRSLVSSAHVAVGVTWKYHNNFLITGLVSWAGGGGHGRGGMKG